MNWLNLEIRTLRSPEYIGSDPIGRATWINVLAYSCEQENGGRIAGAKAWKDRQWQQLCGVTRREIGRAERLLAWDGEDLCVLGYPLAKEAEVKAKREAGREGGRRSGEARSLLMQPGNVGSSASPSADPGASRAASTEEEGEGEWNKNKKENVHRNGSGTGRERAGEAAAEWEAAPASTQTDDAAQGAGVILPGLQDAMAFARENGLAPDITEIWWYECEARPLDPHGNYTDRNGNGIRRWQSHLTGYVQKWEANEAQRNIGNGRRETPQGFFRAHRAGRSRQYTPGSGCSGTHEKSPPRHGVPGGD